MIDNNRWPDFKESNKFWAKIEIDVVKPLKPKFYNRYVDDICRKEIKNQLDQLLEKLKHYQPNIKFTREVDPSKFLDMEIMIKNGIIQTSVVVKVSKTPNH